MVGWIWPKGHSFFLPVLLRVIMNVVIMIELVIHFGYGVGFLREIKDSVFDLRNLRCPLDVYMKILNQQLER